MADYVVWFSEITKNDNSVAGGKGVNLGIMYNLKLPVPPGFVITAQAYKYFVESTNIQSKILDLVKNLDVENNSDLQLASQKIQELILDAKMPREIKDGIVESYDDLNVDMAVSKAVGKDILNSFIKVGREAPFVAVRSSATAEDQADASFAGQQATYLNVKGREDVVLAVQKCWASLFTARAIYYRVKNNFPHEKVYIAVVIQKMVNSEKSGVMFSINPATNNESEIMIEAAFGLGETVVGGEITPDTYIVDKSSMQIKSKKIARQEYGLFRDQYTGKNVKRNLGEYEGSKQKLTEEEIIILAKHGKNLEDYYGKPMDSEWATENGNIYLVQTRPVTTFKKQESQKVESNDLKEILRGLGASPGSASGKVKLIKDLTELSKIEKGDILVTKMTAPDYVPGMKRAVAIVTDEGGITCFGGDTTVLTNKGFKTIEQTYELIKQKEELFIFSYDCKNYRPRWKRILSAGKRKRSAIRTFVSQTGRMQHNTLDITPDHKMFTYENRNLIKKEIHQILEKEEYLCLVEKLPKLSIAKNESKLAYLVGALFSDGYNKVDFGVTGKARRGRVVFTQKEIESKELFIHIVRKYFSEVFNEEFSLIREKLSNSEIRGRHISGTATDFISMKLEPTQKLLDIRNNLDTWLLSLDEESALNFLAGMIDGDGCYYKNRLHIYNGKDYNIKGITIACLKLGIIPQVTKNRDIHHIQIVERIPDILKYTKRVEGDYLEYISREDGTKFLAAKQILNDVVDEVNWGGKIKPYVKRNLLLDVNKILARVVPMANSQLRQELIQTLNSNIRMHRVKKLEDLGEIEVFNLEVEADNELDHNYVVFTKKYSPLLVSNSHAAIVSRELGIPCVVGTEKATQLLHDNDLITVDGSNGIVYSGKSNQVEIKQEIKSEIKQEMNEETSSLITGTKIYMNLGEPDKIDDYKNLPFDGIGLMRIEFIITDSVKKHPLYMIKNGQSQEYIEKLSEGISKVARTIYPKPIIVRFSDFKTNEYKNLEGGSEFEPHEENPMIGWRGCSRYVSPDFIEAFKLELKAIKKCRDQNLKNVHVMLPFVRNTEEVRNCLEILRSEGLVKSHDFGVYLMAEVPAVALITEEFADLPITGASIGSNDLTQGILCVDRDSAKLSRMGYFDERNPAVLKGMSNIIKGFKKHGKTVSICGQSVSEYEEIVEYLIKEGITSVSVNPDVVAKTRKLVASIERNILLGKVRVS